MYIKDPHQKAEACIIWMHGLGADAQDMAGLAEQLPLKAAIRHVFLDAPVRPVTLNNSMPMRAWYDILGTKLTDREDKDGILQSETIIRQVIDKQIADGFSSKQIFLVGFSQGGAMALWTGLNSTVPLAGIIALSAYMPLASICNIELDKQTPILLTGGKFDPLVLSAWGKMGADFLQQKGFKQVTWYEYPMEHAVCTDEMIDIADWLTRQIALVKHNNGEKV